MRHPLALQLAKTFIDIKKQAHRSLTSCLIESCLWIEQLSRTMTEFGAGYGCISFNRCRMNRRKREVLYDPTRASTQSGPSRESAGRTENLKNPSLVSYTYWKTLPFSSIPLCMDMGRLSLKRPSTQPMCSTLIYCCLIYKDQLLRKVPPGNQFAKFSPLLFITFRCYAVTLNMQYDANVSEQNMLTIHTFFIVYPSCLSDFHSPDLDKCLPRVVASFSWISSSKRSGCPASRP